MRPPNVADPFTSATIYQGCDNGMTIGWTIELKAGAYDSMTVRPNALVTSNCRSATILGTTPLPGGVDYPTGGSISVSIG